MTTIGEVAFSKLGSGCGGGLAPHPAERERGLRALYRDTVLSRHCLPRRTYLDRPRQRPRPASSTCNSGHFARVMYQGAYGSLVTPL